MSIWFERFDLDFVNAQRTDNLLGHLAIEFIKADEDSVTARMPVDVRTKQPAGLLHGGASVALAETLATWAACFAVDRSKFYCVGMEINANHLRAVTEGFVYGTARAFHVGRTTHVWDVQIVDERDRLICVSRMTAAVLPAQTTT